MKYYILINDLAKDKIGMQYNKYEVDGEPLPELSKAVGVELFTHINNAGDAIITDKVSGCRIASGDTLNKAVSMLDVLIKKHGSEKLREEIIKRRIGVPELDTVAIY